MTLSVGIRKLAQSLASKNDEKKITHIIDPWEPRSRFYL